MLRDILYTNSIVSPVWYWFLQVRQICAWKDRSYAMPAPHFIKQSTLLRHACRDAVWVETGTYLGETTRFLAKRFPFVYTIEPSSECFRLARKRLRGIRNVELIAGTSEDILQPLLAKVGFQSVCFWLDGHFSAGITFKGNSKSPVLHELEVIGASFQKFDNVVVFIDDVRCAQNDPENYPSLDVYVDWARQNSLIWTVENDIFIAKTSNSEVSAWPD